MYNQFEFVTDELTVLEYIIGSGPLRIPYPPKDIFRASWPTYCNVTATLIDYDKTVAQLFATEIVIQSDDLEILGSTTELTFEAYVDIDPTVIVPEYHIVYVMFIDEKSDEEVDEEAKIVLLIDEILGGLEEPPSFSIAGSKPAFDFDLTDYLTVYEQPLGTMVYESQFGEYLVDIQLDIDVPFVNLE